MNWTPPGPTQVATPPVPAVYDQHTLSNIGDIYTTHLHIDWSVDWDAKLISGSVTHDLTADADVMEVVLDTSYLDIHKVHLNGTQVEFKLDERKSTLGAALHIPLGKTVTKGEQIKVKVDYSTTPQCTALGWLKASQTAGKTAPFLYSQCQAIHCRSLLPCMDSPARKIPYPSSVRSKIPILMSALPTHSHRLSTEFSDEVKQYTFAQKIGIPSYLIAIVAGHIAYRDLGPRTGIYAEVPMIEKAKWEFEADAEKFLAAAEKTVSAYSWERYDSVVLPPSFPYGGMENANLTTLTPSLVCGDRTLTDVLAHELMHSWSGNLTSCANWEHFWLNEGWTVYLERLLLREVHGGGAQGEAHRGFSFIIGAKALQNALEQFKDTPRFQKLIPVFEGVQDPDDAFSSIPYEKGSNFLYHLEQVVGGLDNFLPYAKSYFATFFNRSVTTGEWKTHLYSFFEGSPDIIKGLDAVQWDKWLHGDGLQLPVQMEYDQTLAKQAFALADRWLAVIQKSKDSTEVETATKEFDAHDIKGWNANQIVVFLERLHSGPEVPASVTNKLDGIYGFSKAVNGEVLLRFFEVALEVKEGKFANQAVEWVKTQGRMKFCRTIFRALYKVEPELARKTFKENQSFYHPIAASQIEKDLHLDTSGAIASVAAKASEHGQRTSASARPRSRDVVAVIGSTGTGKSQLAVELALAYGRTSPVAKAEVISADSMQVYRGLDVITNKAMPEETKGIPHHLMDFLQPTEEYDVGTFRADALKIINSKQDMLPILAGGTTYYIQHLLFPGRLVSADATTAAEQGAPASEGESCVDSDPTIRAIIDQLVDQQRILWHRAESGAIKTEEMPDDERRVMWSLLQALDPEMASRWHWRDTRKVIRSIRVIQTTGKRHSQWIQDQDEQEQRRSASLADDVNVQGGDGAPPWRILLFWVWRDSTKLNASLNDRIRKMVARGLLEEIRELRHIVRTQPEFKAEYTRGIFQAIGFKEFDDYLTFQEQRRASGADKEADALFDSAISQMETATRQYAKKQVSWIRNKLGPEVRKRLKADQAEDRVPSVELFLLDASDDWNRDVHSPALSIFHDWLAEKPLPDPLSLSLAAKEKLELILQAAVEAQNGSTPGKEAFERNRMQQCEDCSELQNTPVWIRAAEWEVHIKSKGHRRARFARTRLEDIERRKAEGLAKKALRHREEEQRRREEQELEQ